MIYFDNAATTMIKPPTVAQAVAAAIGSFGGVGRGAHDASLSADLTVFRARSQIAHLLGAPDAKLVAFSLNVTEALNIAITGLLHTGDHAITTAASHNSVLRPLYRAQEERGVALSIVPVAPDASIDYEAFERSFTPATRVVAVTHASNLTGDIYDVERMARIAHQHNAIIIVDAAQTAGSHAIDMQAQGLDIVAFTGHKGLYGPQGTGGLAQLRDYGIPPYSVGGSGTHSYEHNHPAFLPERLEAGTPNAHGIAGLSAGLAYIEETGVEGIGAFTGQLADRFEAGVRTIDRVTVYGGQGGIGRCGIVALNIGDVDSAEVADVLNVEFGICTRAGAHCAPLMHEALGTDRQGAVRFSFSSFNTADEVDEGIRAVAAIAQSLADEGRR